jgi:predicted DNA-binding transcriptional regulator AlpA
VWVAQIETILQNRGKANNCLQENLVHRIQVISLPRKQASVRHLAILAFGASASIKSGETTALPKSSRAPHQKSASVQAKVLNSATRTGLIESNEVNRKSHDLSPEPSPEGKKHPRRSDYQARIAIELESAITLHKAGLDSTVKKPVVCAVKGWSRATLYRRIAEGNFPKPLKRGRYSEWRIADVIATP